MPRNRRVIAAALAVLLFGAAAVVFAAVVHDGKGDNSAIPNSPTGTRAPTGTVNTTVIPNLVSSDFGVSTGVQLYTEKIDQIDQDIAAGHSKWDAVIDATVRRARPILLTAGTAIFAMIPLSRSVFWGPMAVALMGGLLVATALTLLFLPALYAAWFRVRQPAVTPALAESAAHPPLALAAE